MFYRAPLVLPNRCESESDLPGIELQHETAEGLLSSRVIVLEWERMLESYLAF